MKRYIKLNNLNTVISVRHGFSIVENEIETDLGEIGQIQQLDGSFINDTTPIIQPIPQPTNQELADNQIILMDALATMFEGMLMKGTV